MIENEILNLFALARSIRANAEKIGRRIDGDGANVIEGIERMCDITEDKLTLLQKNNEVKNV